jgi:hypothetical protein
MTRPFVTPDQTLRYWETENGYVLCFDHMAVWWDGGWDGHSSPMNSMNVMDWESESGTFVHCADCVTDPID